tara:strand:+ start:329 stop:742 length:414 start_codon:yes stop_codon:yes gene_type:complete
MENSDIQNGELNEFKSQVKQWLSIDEEIMKHEKKIKDLKKLKANVLEPQITKFMVIHNVRDLNTEQGKIRCNERNVKKPLNKKNIRENLSQVITDNTQIEQAMQLIMNNREVVTKHILTKPKVKDKNKKELPINTNL